MHLQKENIRRTIREIKKTYNKEELLNDSSLLVKKLEEMPLFQKADTILLYHSLPDEVFTHSFIEKWHSTKKIVLPVIEGDTIKLGYYNGKENLKTGAYHIEEPIHILSQEEYSEVDLAIIPGMAFDQQGNRLGRGKGYYDRLLSSLSCPKIGICFHFQFLEKLPTALHDIPMDMIVTPEQTLSL